MSAGRAVFSAVPVSSSAAGPASTLPALGKIAEWLERTTLRGVSKAQHLYTLA